MNKVLTTEAKLTLSAGGLGVVTVLLDFIDQSEGKLPDSVLITILCCITAIIVSYNISRGMAKYEHYSVVPQPPQSASPSASAPKFPQPPGVAKYEHYSVVPQPPQSGQW